MTNGAKKGSSYEREICKKLSLWWTYGEDDDVFWRTAGSGARATGRRKQGKKTFGQDGDIQATNPIGQPFVDLFAVEIKRGYKDANPMSVFDHKPGKPLCPFLKFIQQADRACSSSESPFWLIIHKRDRKVEMIYFSFLILRDLGLPPNFKNSVTVKSESLRPYARKVFGCTLKEFLSRISPEHIRELHGKYF